MGDDGRLTQENGRGPEAGRRVAITPEILAQLRAEFKRTDVAAQKLLQNASDVPEGLTAETIRHWQSGRMKTARKHHLYYVLALWAALPTVGRRVSITPEIQALLLAERERTGVGPQALLRDTRAERPAGLSVETITAWLRGTHNTARQDHLDFVLTRWAALPGETPSFRFDGQLRRVASPGRVPLTTTVRQQLYAEYERTGVTPFKLLRVAPDQPNRVNPLTV